MRTPTLAAVCLIAAAGAARLAGMLPAAHIPQDPPAKHRFGLPEPLPRTPGAVRIATWNVLNLFDDQDDPLLSGEFDDIKFTTEPERLEALARGIREVDADIIALQEVESYDAINWFRDRYLEGMGYEFAASEDVGYYRGVECSVLSRFPIRSVEVWPNESLAGVDRDGIGWAPVPPSKQELTYQRSPLMVDVQIRRDYALTLFILHHKAGADFDYHREAEALRTVEKINQLQQKNPSQNVLVLGDFNCAPWDKSFRVYLEAGMIDSLAHRLIERGNPESDLYKTHESDRVLDYILLNSAAHRELVIGSPHVYSPFTPPASYNWRTDPRPAGYASDHYPVIIEIQPRDLR